MLVPKLSLISRGGLNGREKGCPTERVFSGSSPELVQMCPEVWDPLGPTYMTLNK